MATIGNLTLRVDDDYLRLVAYRTALRWIVEQGRTSSWERDDDEPEPYDIAEAALRAFGEDAT
jgi:hypothetical protein